MGSAAFENCDLARKNDPVSQLSLTDPQRKLAD
jgi:hypothetical protein